METFLKKFLEKFQKEFRGGFSGSNPLRVLAAISKGVHGRFSKAVLGNVFMKFYINRMEFPKRI